MKIPSLSLLAVLISAPSFAEWTLQADQSQVYFSTVKKDTLAETHQFKTLKGNVSADGKFTIAIDLASAETGVAIRNERIAQFLFETTKFTQATGKGTIDLAAVSKQPIGSSQAVKVPVTFDLHGKTVSKDVNLLITKISATEVDVSTPAPIFLNAADFELSAGIEKLKELATLTSISPIVPVSLHLHFNQHTSNKTSKAAPAIPAGSDVSGY